MTATVEEAQAELERTDSLRRTEVSMSRRNRLDTSLRFF